MELNSSSSVQMTRKRKRSEDGDPMSSAISFDELNQDLLEQVLSRLSTTAFFRCRSVCKRWSSVATSATFRIACSHLPSREPWFYMVGSELHRSIVFDTSEWSWKNLNHLNFLQQFNDLKPIPVASSGGLVCFRTMSGGFIISNPVTGAHRELPSIGGMSIDTQPIHAIAMNSIIGDQHMYKLVVVSGEYPNVSIKVYNSLVDGWEEDIRVQRPNNTEETEMHGDNTLYFLSKAGEVVATDMQRSPSKQYSSVITVESGEEVIDFLSPSGAIVACNLSQRTFLEYPRLLPIYVEYSIDVVECQGEMLAVILSDFIETANLRVWKFSKRDRLWNQVASMPPAMSHDLYGKKVDINCVGIRGMILVCVSSTTYNSSFVCDLSTDKWVELPKCLVDGDVKEFMSAFSFEPRIEACV